MNYVYRVTAELVKLADGRKAHVAKYAYKPFRDDKENSKLFFSTGCAASERMTLKSDLIVTLDREGVTGTLYANVAKLKVFHDDYNFGSERMPKLGDVERIRASKVFNVKYVGQPAVA